MQEQASCENCNIERGQLVGGVEMRLFQPAVNFLDMNIGFPGKRDTPLRLQSPCSSPSSRCQMHTRSMRTQAVQTPKLTDRSGSHAVPCGRRNQPFRVIHLSTSAIQAILVLRSGSSNGSTGRGGGVPGRCWPSWASRNGPEAGETQRGRGASHRCATGPDWARTRNEKAPVSRSSGRG
jgi:hypothetical protein